MKRFIWFLCGVLSLLFLILAPSTNASALELKKNPRYLGIDDFTFLDFAGVNITSKKDVNGAIVVAYYFPLASTSISNSRAFRIHLTSGTNAVAGESFQFNISILTDSATVPNCPRAPTSSLSQWVIDSCSLSNSSFSDFRRIIQNTVNDYSVLTDVYTLTSYTITGHFLTSFNSQSMDFHSSAFYALPVSDFQLTSYVTVSNFEIFTSSDPSSEQAHNDSQAQLDQDKQQFDKEQEQREEDKQQAQNTGDQSQSSSDTAQSDVDNSSKSLLQILTQFASAITSTSAGDCSITGDFGYFDAGDINLCTGASKITPVTNVVGSVMLIGLCIPAVVTLLHRFLDLYNEVTS